MIQISGDMISWDGQLGCMPISQIPSKYGVQNLNYPPREFSVHSSRTNKWQKFAIDPLIIDPLKVSSGAWVSYVADIKGQKISIQLSTEDHHRWFVADILEREHDRDVREFE